MENQVLKTIAERCSVRSYTPQSVPEEYVTEILKAAMAAPSSKNRQPWELVVVRSKSVLEALGSRLKHAAMTAHAPLAIVVCAKTHITLSDGSVEENRSWKVDAAAVTENILLAVTSLGLGAVWTEASDAERSGIVRDVLGIPEEVSPFCVIPIGYPAGEEKPKDKWNPSKIHYDKW